MAEIGIDTSGLENVQFGMEIREKEFCLSPKTGILNSGSYGNTPRRVLEMQKRYDILSLSLSLSLLTCMHYCLSVCNIVLIVCILSRLVPLWARAESKKPHL